MTSALMIWKTLILVTGSESPVSPDHVCRCLSHCHIDLGCLLLMRTRQSGGRPVHTTQVVVVLSGSMEPGFYRGDILFLCVSPIFLNVQ